MYRSARVASGIWLGLTIALSAPGARAQSPSPAATTPATAAAVPVEAFFSRPSIESVQLSPSGRWLAVNAAAGSSRVGIAIFDLQTMKPVGLAARFAAADIGDVRWVNDSVLVFEIQDNQRGGADQRFWPGLFAVNRDGSDGVRQLVDIEKAFVTVGRTTGRQPLSVHHRLLHVPSGGGDEVIVGEWISEGFAQQPSINAKRLDITSGRTTSLAAGAPPNVRDWIFDAKGDAVLVTTRLAGRTAYHWRDDTTGNWKRLAEFDSQEAPWMPRFVDAGGGLYVTVAAGRDGTSELRRFDFATGKPAADALVRTPGFDFLGELVAESQGGQVLGIRVTTDAETTVWFEPRLQALQKAADERLPGHVNRITCRRCLSDEVTAVVYSYSDRDPGQYHIYTGIDRNWRKLGDSRPDIDPRLMATTDFERVRMRDGLEIPVWITQPAGKADGPLPAVVLVHGGPWVRGRAWNWSRDAQFLASRGYVVIEPEFRGSRGYGQRLYRAGWRQWGQAMQDDLVDSLKWTAGKGLVDPARVCIAGASYGGYATLMGLVRHPEAFRCGVAWVAVTDPRLVFKWSFISDQSDEIRQVDYPTLIGDPSKDQAMLEANSPVLQARRIKAPVMLAVGRDDRRVPLEHGTRMRDALTEAGNPPLWLSYADEGHVFFKTENRIDFMRQMQTFLDRNTARR